MNIFALSQNPTQCAIWHLDKHIVKMPLETAQMLCTVLNKIGIETPYKPCHVKHPCTLWAGMNRSNFSWLCDLGVALCNEYTYRYEKNHKSYDVIEYCREKMYHLEDGGLTEFAQAMPDEYKDKDAVIAYRRYYKFGKSHLFSWKKRLVPDFVL